jgi:hypothetical protein
MTRPPSLDRLLFDAVSNDGRYERDLLYQFIHHHSQLSIEQALKRLCDRRLFRKCGDAARPIYVRDTPHVRYTNIIPVHGVEKLLTMHANWRAP